MIIEYLRPDTLEEAINLLNRREPKSIPLGGGTNLAQKRSDDAIAVIDLQALGMREIVLKNGYLEIGANVTLQRIYDSPQVPAAIRASVAREGNFNLRQMATIGGTVASSDCGSPFVALLQAGDAEIIWEPGHEPFKLIEFTPVFRRDHPGFISSLKIPLPSKFAMESVSRTPLSESILCVCGAQNQAGNTRILIADSSKSLAGVIFEGALQPGKPDPIMLASNWVENGNIRDPYLGNVLGELIDRLLTELRKEG